MSASLEAIAKQYVGSEAFQAMRNGITTTLWKGKYTTADGTVSKKTFVPLQLRILVTRATGEVTEYVDGLVVNQEFLKTESGFTGESGTRRAKDASAGITMKLASFENLRLKREGVVLAREDESDGPALVWPNHGSSWKSSVKKVEAMSPDIVENLLNNNWYTVDILPVIANWKDVSVVVKYTD